MATTSNPTGYTPGQYGKKRMSANEWININIRKWTSREEKKIADASLTKEPPVICFSRKIGVGALEIADTLAKKINFRVVDREIIEHMAQDADLMEKTVSLFDERYPGKMAEFMSMLTSEKSFVKLDYAKQLVKSAVTLANLEPTIFVGRGIHLLLPRQRVLAVRFICSQEFRIKRLAQELGIEKERAETRLRQYDKEQRDFFKTVYQKNEASPYEFDLVINRDFLSGIDDAADLVALAYEKKFNLS